MALWSTCFRSQVDSCSALLSVGMPLKTTQRCQLAQNTSACVLNGESGITWPNCCIGCQFLSKHYLWCWLLTLKPKGAIWRIASSFPSCWTSLAHIVAFRALLMQKRAFLGDLLPKTEVVFYLICVLPTTDVSHKTSIGLLLNCLFCLLDLCSCLLKLTGPIFNDWLARWIWFKKSWFRFLKNQLFKWFKEKMWFKLIFKI